MKYKDGIGTGIELYHTPYHAPLYCASSNFSISEVARLGQLVEHRTSSLEVLGSNPHWLVWSSHIIANFFEIGNILNKL